MFNIFKKEVIEKAGCEPVKKEYKTYVFYLKDFENLEEFFSSIKNYVSWLRFGTLILKNGMVVGNPLNCSSVTSRNMSKWSFINCLNLFKERTYTEKHPLILELNLNDGKYSIKYNYKGEAKEGYKLWAGERVPLTPTGLEDFAIESLEIVGEVTP